MYPVNKNIKFEVTYMQDQQEERYIPINKGHFELDTKMRSAAFSARLSTGWEKEYSEYRNLWVELPKNRTVRDYPLLVDLELSSICNLNCPMCYTITEEFRKKVKKGLMDMNLFRKVIDEISGSVFAVRLSLRGEPTLHPDFIEAIRYAKEQGVREVSFLTNGSTLTIDNFRSIAEAGADWITVSVDGTGDEYNKIRRPLIFEDTLEKLTEIARYKKEKSLAKPVIKVQGIWPAIRPAPEFYYNTLAPVCDLLAYNPLIDYLNKDTNIVYEDTFACPQLYQRIVIGSDGMVMMCSNDEEGEYLIGNAEHSSVHELWHSEQLERIRKIHNQLNGFKEIPVCLKCYYPRKAVVDESAIVNGRTVYIENYLYREQNIGN